jgi:hypothetical protein
VTGYSVNSVDEAIAAVVKAACLDRAAVRWRFLERFTAARMAFDYLDLYEKLLSSSHHADRSSTQTNRDRSAEELARQWAD